MFDREDLNFKQDSSSVRTTFDRIGLDLLLRPQATSLTRFNFTLFGLYCQLGKKPIGSVLLSFEHQNRIILNPDNNYHDLQNIELESARLDAAIRFHNTHCSYHTNKSIANSFCKMSGQNI